MPNRIIREGILTSERINTLDWSEEVFFRRLLSVVDDYGRCEAHIALLRASLYPLKLDQVREANVERLLASCEKARLVRLYTVGSKSYLQVADFRQQTRSASKYPPPPDTQTPSTCAADAKQPLSSAHLGGDVVVSVVEGVSVSPPPAGGESESQRSARQLKLNEIFHRRPTTQWSAEELKLFKAAGLDRMPDDQFAAEVGVVLAFYQATIPEALAKKFWRRTELGRVLRHWPGELGPNTCKN